MDWCKCGKCEFSTTLNEEIFYQNPLVLEKEVCAGEECVTATDAFKSECWNKHVLTTALATWDDFYHDNKDLKNKNFRFIAYKQYLSWSYGYLGKKNRKPLPNCAVTVIRPTFPHSRVVR